MKNKLLFTLLISVKLWASSTNYMDQKFKDLYDILSYQNIMITFGEVSDDFKLYNIDALGAFTQGTDSTLQILVKGLKPFNIFKESIILQSLSGDVKERFLNLPNMPKEIKESKENLCVHVFAYAAEAFGKEEDPLFIYATRQVEADDVITPLSMEDFDYTDSLIRYRQICSMIRLLPLNHLEDETEKFNCLKDAANIGIIEAQHNCGLTLYIGDVESQNKKEAFQYFKMAADQGFKEAQFNCGVMLDKGAGVTQDLEEAFRYYKLAADQGIKDAQSYCGTRLLYTEDSIAENKTEAFKYLKMAADQGIKDAQSYCGNMLYNGDNVNQDKVEAFHYYKLAANQGCVSSQFTCGVMLEKGEDVTQNSVEAFYYFKLAGDQGYAVAQFHCGQMLSQGRGVEKNLHEALKYYELAEKRIYEPANIEVVKTKADLGMIEYCFKYAKLLEKGDGVTQNRVEALKYYELAADQGLKEALEYIEKDKFY